MVLVLDTNTIIAAVRSPSGASAELLRRVLQKQLTLACSVPLFLEYEAVLLRQEHLEAAQITAAQASNVLDVLAGVVQRVDIRYLWRPCLRDANDDMVLETAVNGHASVIITLNGKDFLPQAHTFGVSVCTAKQYLQGALDGNT